MWHEKSKPASLHQTQAGSLFLERRVWIQALSYKSDLVVVKFHESFGNRKFMEQKGLVISHCEEFVAKQAIGVNERQTLECLLSLLTHLVSQRHV